MARFYLWFAFITASISYASARAATSIFFGLPLTPKSDENKLAMDDSGPVSRLAVLVTNVQDIYREHGCPFTDPDGKCSPGPSPGCLEVVEAGSCVLSSCRQLSSEKRGIVANHLVQIANIAFDCGLNEDDLNNPGLDNNGAFQQYNTQAFLLLAVSWSLLKLLTCVNLL